MSFDFNKLEFSDDIGMIAINVLYLEFIRSITYHIEYKLSNYLKYGGVDYSVCKCVFLFYSYAVWLSG